MSEKKEVFMTTYEDTYNNVIIPLGVFSSPESAIEALKNFHEDITYIARTDEVDIEEELSWGNCVDIPVTEKYDSDTWERDDYILHLYRCKMDEIADEAYNY